MKKMAKHRLTPQEARDRKYGPARVDLIFGNGQTIGIPSPALQCWLAYAATEGADPTTNPVVYMDGTTQITITKGVRL